MYKITMKLHLLLILIILQVTYLFIHLFILFFIHLFIHLSTVLCGYFGSGYIFMTFTSQSSQKFQLQFMAIYSDENITKSWN